MSIKNIAYKIHTYLSLTICILFTIICISGSLLVYKDELNSLFSPNTTDIIGGGEQRLSVDELVKIINSHYKNYEIVGINIDKNSQKNYKIWLIKHDDPQKEWLFTYINPTSGKITLEPTPHDEGFWGILLHIHEILLIENGGNFIVGIIGILSILVLFSGFIIYRNFYKNLFLLRRKNLAIFMSDIHKFIGVFSTPILLATAISGIWWEFRFLFMPHFDNSNFIIDNKIYNKSISLDDLIKRANDDLKGFNTHYISLPFFDGANIRLFGYVKTQNFLFNEYSSQVIYDKNNANLVQIQDISKQNFSGQFLETFRKAHFGNYNQFTKLLWFLAGLSPLILTISGIYLWIKRKKFKRREN